MSTADIERRRSPRVALSVRVTGVTEDRALALGACRDISRHGMFVTLVLTRPDEEVKLGAKVRLKFRPPNSDHPIEVVAAVARQERDEEGAQAGIGVDFIRVALEDMSLIEEYIVSTLLRSQSDPGSFL